MTKAIYGDEHAKLKELLRRFRKSAGVTQGDLADRLGLPQSFVSKYESGERRLDLVELRRVCLALNLKLADFVKVWEESL